MLTSSSSSSSREFKKTSVYSLPGGAPPTRESSIAGSINSKYASIQVAIDPALYLDVPPSTKDYPQLETLSQLSYKPPYQSQYRDSAASHDLPIRPNTVDPDRQKKHQQYLPQLDSNLVYAPLELERSVSAEGWLLQLLREEATGFQVPLDTPKTLQHRRSSEIFKAAEQPRVKETPTVPNLNRPLSGLSKNVKIQEIARHNRVDKSAITESERIINIHADLPSPLSSKTPSILSQLDYVKPKHQDLVPKPLDFHKFKNFPTRSKLQEQLTKAMMGPTIPLPRLPLQDKDWYKPRYTSGPIQTQSVFGLYTIPVMTAMDVLCNGTTMTEDQVIDETVEFFESYGFEPVVSSLDQYWTRTYEAPSTISYSNYDKNYRHRSRGWDSKNVNSIRGIMPGNRGRDIRSSPKTLSSAHSLLMAPSQTPPIFDSPSLSSSPSKFSSNSTPNHSPLISLTPTTSKRFSAALSFLRGATSNSQRREDDNESISTIDMSSAQQFAHKNITESDIGHANLSPRKRESNINIASQFLSATIRSPSRLNSKFWGGLKVPDKKTTSTTSSGLLVEANNTVKKDNNHSEQDTKGQMPSLEDASKNASKASKKADHLGAPAQKEYHDEDNVNNGTSNKKQSKLSLKKLFAKSDLSGLGAYDVYYS